LGLVVEGGVFDPLQPPEAVQEVKVVPLGELQESVVLLAFDGTGFGLARSTTVGVVTLTVTLSEPWALLAPTQVILKVVVEEIGLETIGAVLLVLEVLALFQALFAGLEE
jgi:hypothetical protein